jgi:hypothetical protein
MNGGRTVEMLMASTLKAGEVFTRDLLDSTGQLVLSAGKAVDLEILGELARRQCLHVYFADDCEPQETDLLRPYNAAHMRQLRISFEDTPSLIDNLGLSLERGEYADVSDIEQSIESNLVAVKRDPAAALATALNIDLPTEHSPSLRSVRLSCMSMVAAQLMGCSDSDCKSVGRAGLLHDISLPADRLSLNRILEKSAESEPIVNFYRTHPLRSAELLRKGLLGINELDLVLVSQVHEQCDGSGFPRGLKKHRLHPLSRLLNIIDAFLTLIDPQHPKGGYVPADALAYLVLHTIYGSFDQACVQALIGAAAIYPVGSQVVLSDNTTGTVIRSTGRDYTRPVIRMDDGSNRMIDLRRHATQIVGPIPLKSLRRLPKSLMDEVLWMGENYC